jgi:hypothetical protein
MFQRMKTIQFSGSVFLTLNLIVLTLLVGCATRPNPPLSGAVVYTARDGLNKLVYCWKNAGTDNTGRLLPLPKEPAIHPPTVSPDGSLVAYTALVPDPTAPGLGVAILNMHIQDSHFTKVYSLPPPSNGSGVPSIIIPTTDQRQDYVSPIRWSPDSRKIALVFDRLYLMDDNGSNLVSTPSALELYPLPCWAPDSTFIAVGSGNKVVIFDTFAKPVRTLNQCRPLGWMRDGRRVVVLDSASDDNETTVRIIDINSTDEKRLSLGSISRSYIPELSPDTSKLAFVSQDQKLGFVRLDGTGKTLLMMGNWRVPTYFVRLFWSPDSRQLAMRVVDRSRIVGGKTTEEADSVRTVLAFDTQGYSPIELLTGNYITMHQWNACLPE